MIARSRNRRTGANNHVGRDASNKRVDVERIRAVPIATVAAELGFRLNQRGGGLCRLPGHEDRRPSFTLRLSSNSFKCFACGRGGSVIDLVMTMEGLDFLQACHWLSERYLGERDTRTLSRNRASASHLAAPRSTKVATPTTAPDPELYSWLLDRSPLCSDGVAYLTARGFSAATLQAFRIGQIGDRAPLRRAAVDHFGEQRLRRCGLLRDGRWGAELVFPTRYLLFPFLVAGAVTYLQARRPDAKSDYRWFCPAGLLPPAYNVDALDGDQATILICEGVTDTLSAFEMGHAAIGVVGANARLEQQIIARLRGRNIVLVGDRDAAGRAFARDTVRLLSQRGITAISRSLPADINDLNDLLRQQRGLVQ